MRQAIQTKYYGPTNHKGSRIRVKADAKTIWVSWDYSLEVSENHKKAAEKLFTELNWDSEGTKLMGGSLPGNGYCFVMVG